MLRLGYEGTKPSQFAKPSPGHRPTAKGLKGGDGFPTFHGIMPWGGPVFSPNRVSFDTSSRAEKGNSHDIEMSVSRRLVRWATRQLHFSNRLPG